MQAQQREQRATLRNFHGQKKQLLGNHVGQAAPAWKVNQQHQHQQTGLANGTNASGSKILLSHLPPDVTSEEVRALFMKTIGPVEEAFVVYNSQGNSKGMAVVKFARVGDAYEARAKYNGKIIDSRRPIKIEVIQDEDKPTIPAPAPAKTGGLSLLQRLGGVPPKNTAATAVQFRKQNHVAPKVAPVAVARQPRIPGPKNLRQKKGPKRVKKAVTKKTVAELDAEMDAYKAGTEDTSMN